MWVYLAQQEIWILKGQQPLSMIYQDLGSIAPNFSEWIPFPVSPVAGKGIFCLRFMGISATNDYLLLRAKFLDDFQPSTGAIIFPVNPLESLIFEFDLIQHLNHLTFIMEARKRNSPFNNDWSVNLLQILD